MKLKRAKTYRKQMQYMQLNFKFREPYQVLVDEEIILEALSCKYDLKAGLERTLQGEVKILITQCTMEHLYRTKSTAAIELAKTFERRRCGHLPKDDQTLSAFECIRNVVDVKGQNKHRYVVATQKPKLREKFRRIPAVPLIYLARSVMIMEPLSPLTLSVRANIERSKLTEGLNSVKDDDSETEEAEVTSKKRKRSRQPNPLSVKKKAKSGSETSAEQGEGKKRRKRGSKRKGDKDESTDTLATASADTIDPPSHSQDSASD